GLPPLLSQFPTPPMLRRSWDLIVGESANREDVVPVGSLAAQIGGWGLSNSVWLRWRNRESDGSRAYGGLSDLELALVRERARDGRLDLDEARALDKAAHAIETELGVLVRRLGIPRPTLRSAMDGALGQLSAGGIASVPTVGHAAKVAVIGSPPILLT